jgi:tetratricopeptide (TPR) repeat protein
MHQYELAGEFFTRLLRSARDKTPEKLELLGKCAYSNFFSGDYRRVLYLLELKDWDDVNQNKQAEFRFLRASAYWALRDQDSARAEIVNLASLTVEPNKDPYWNFWWKYVGNSLANDLFAQNDYAMAHKIYYSLLHLSEEKKWQLPIVFQIGRCRESLGDSAEAMGIYAKILEEIGAIAEAGREQNLVVLKTRVEDQIDNLEWEQQLGDARRNFAPKLDRTDEHASTESLTTAYAGGS